MVVVAMDYAGRPSSYAWLFGRVDDTGPMKSADTKNDEQIDFRPNVDSSPVGIQLTQPRTPEDANRYKDHQEQRTTDHKLKIDSDLVSQIKDNSVGIRASERDLMNYLLAKTRDVPLSALKSEARDDIAFGVLMNDSEDFLCTLMSVRGEIRRLNAISAFKNEYGVEKVYEAWLFNRDAGKRPYRILCTSIPDGIPTGMELKSGTVVTVTGYYFKRYGYPAVGNRLHVAPLIIGKTLEWHRPESATRPNDMDIIPYVLGFAGFVGIAAGITLWRFRKSDKEFERKHLNIHAFGISKSLGRCGICDKIVIIFHINLYHLIDNSGIYEGAVSSKSDYNISFVFFGTFVVSAQDIIFTSSEKTYLVLFTKFSNHIILFSYRSSNNSFNNK